MRKITILRKKSIVGCACKVFIYTIDNLNNDEDINDIFKDRCIFLGMLKNGETLETEITENSITIIAAYESLGVFMPTDYVTIPAGTEPVTINGKAKLSPSKGNPFIFID